MDLSLRLDPDVVVLDIAMPGLDGFQAAAQIRKGGLNCPHRVPVPLRRRRVLSSQALLRGPRRLLPSRVLSATSSPQSTMRGRGGRSSLAPARFRAGVHGRAGDTNLQLYGTDVFLVDAVVTFFDNALEAGDSIIACSAICPHRHAFDLELRARGLDVDALIVARPIFGRSTRTTALEAILLDGMPDRDKFMTLLDPMLERGLAAASGSPPQVTIFGEIALILCANRQFDAMLRLEQIADEAAASRPMSILCGYCD